MNTIPVGLVGVTGYAGMELARLLTLHPSFTLARATSRSEAGKRLVDIYPFVQSLPMADLVITEPDPADLARACEVVFLAVPHSAAMDMAATLRAEGLKVVDLSADFRLRDPEVYGEWYNVDHRHPDLIAEAVYGLVELYREPLHQASLVANPGCYPTAAILALHPALQAGCIEPEGLVVDAKSGASGAGRKASVGTLFCEVHDSFRAYNLGKHRHTPEIEQELSLAAGRDLVLSFNTHLLPVDRGILATCYGTLRDGVDYAAVREAYEQAYAGEGWIRLLPEGRLPETRYVRGTMFCDIGLVHDPRTNRLLALSAIDNLCRGASGQALACANIMCGLDEAEGLYLPPLMP